ncbi:MAG: ribosomal RNA small subunit methyltransferase A [Candidatus Marinimicrobia bacterium]|nr:ribosomal RNA small subunit methyltransferase A [Candidatus Neomarinimicrobiota bacterium]
MIDKNIIRKCIRAINPAEGDIFVEIGPGKGSLTNELVEYGVEIIAIEIDRNLCDFLIEKYSCNSNIKIINEDILKFDFENIFEDGIKLRVVGNIPYNITSPLIFKLIENREIIKDVHLMVQKDVALRLIAKPGTKEYGILSVILGLVADIEKLFDVSNKCFYPFPEVMSSFIKIEFKDMKIEGNFYNDFKEIVKISFNKRRKTLKNALKDFVIDENKCPIELSRRAETLTPEEFILLTKFLINGY